MAKKLKKSKVRKSVSLSRRFDRLGSLPSSISPTPRRRLKTRVALGGFVGVPYFPRGVIRESTNAAKAWSLQANRPLLNKAKICSDRQTRRNVLFKIGFAGKGKVKFAKWTNQSKVRC